MARNSGIPLLRTTIDAIVEVGGQYTSHSVGKHCKVLWTDHLGRKQITVIAISPANNWRATTNTIGQIRRQAREPA